MTFKQGTLVRVLPVEEMTDMTEEPDAEDIKDIEQISAKHGYIYTVEKFVPKRQGDARYASDSYVCRSLATGKVQDLFVWEITDEGAS